MAITLINCSGVSFRSVSKIFLVMRITFNLNIRVPSHTTILNWVKKQGIANFRGKDFFNEQNWILIIDESIQFGNKKLLAVVAVPANKQILGRALNYKDLVPLVLKSSESWKSDDIITEIRACINLEKVLYVVSDNGNNLKSSYEKLGLKHIEDVGHKFSWIIKEVYDKQDDFEKYTKQLAGMRTKLSMSKYSHIIPPNQRIISRFMNLTPLFKWGCKMIDLLEKNILSPEEKEKVEFVIENKEFIQQTNVLLTTLNKVQQILKTKGFNKNTIKESSKKLKALRDKKGKTVSLMINQYFKDTLQKMETEKTILCSSDILESCFGKYKSVVKANKTVGITDLCLCISALLNDGNLETTKQAMISVKTTQIKEWKDKNIGETLFEKRNKFYKKTG
jgi:hypothetical protein